MELDKNIKQQLAELLADPQKVCSQHTAMLNELLQEYPYYQPLHLLLAKAHIYMGDTDALAKAALYANGQLLHQFLYKASPEKVSFKVVNTGNSCDDPNEAEEEDFTTEQQDEIVELTEVTDPSAGIETVETLEETPEISDTEEEETFEEITEVDLNNYRPFRNSDQGTEKQENTGDAPLRKNSLEDDFVFESIASTDFFAFQEKFSTEAPAVDTQEKAPAAVLPADEQTAETENSQVSNYHDEKLPYTFLWWLAKTRKEHQSIFQPYALTKKGNSQELQQQYVEHIFHIQSHLTGSEALLNHQASSKPATKDAEIIESFIKNDPQITPPHAEQIDNENKAKKSAEDQNDLVSETLASIYIEQMLYDKAIDTYEKLSLKFPEKRRYFADLIQSIEKKI